MEAATCWLRLGRPEDALSVFGAAPGVWAPHLRRDHGLHLARRANAHAAVAEVALACDLAQQAITAARQTASARTRQELVRLAGQLTAWPARPDATAVRSAVASLVGPPCEEAAEVHRVLSTATSTDEARREASIAVLPVGSFEQHGDHLPLSTDTLIACLIAREVADRYGLFLLPPVTIACSHEHAGWPGTVSIRASTLHALVTDVAASLEAGGVHRLLIVNGHGGNYVLSNIVQEASVAGPRMALFPGRDDWRSAREAAGCEVLDAHDDMHAGELETSLLLHAMPDVVRPSHTAADHDAPHRPHLLSLGLRAYTTSGVMGRPSLATAEKGKAILDALADRAASHVQVLSDGSGPDDAGRTRRIEAEPADSRPSSFITPGPDGG
jgi:creatinine amidohydrolase